MLVSNPRRSPRRKPRTTIMRGLETRRARRDRSRNQKRGTTKDAKDTKGNTRKEISHRWTQINTDDFPALSFVLAPGSPEKGISGIIETPVRSSASRVAVS